VKYSANIAIQLPRQRVIELDDAPQNLSPWQEGLQSRE